MDKIFYYKSHISSEFGKNWTTEEKSERAEIKNYDVRWNLSPILLRKFPV